MKRLMKYFLASLQLSWCLHLTRQPPHKSWWITEGKLTASKKIASCAHSQQKKPLPQGTEVVEISGMIRKNSYEINFRRSLL